MIGGVTVSITAPVDTAARKLREVLTAMAGSEDMLALSDAAHTLNRQLDPAKRELRSCYTAPPPLEREENPIRPIGMSGDVVMVGGPWRAPGDVDNEIGPDED